jgi:hypothetical protein
MENIHTWWEKLGTAQYGGEFNIRLNRKIANFDPYFGYHLTQIHTAWLEKMFVDDWTLAPEKYDYTKNLRPNQWVKGHLAENWEFTRPVHICGSFYAGESTGKPFRRRTAVSLSPMM